MATVTVEFNVFNLKQQLEMAKGREISWAEMARETGLNRNTVEKVAKNATGRVDLATLAAFIAYFHDQGMPIGADELLRVTVE